MNSFDFLQFETDLLNATRQVVQRLAKKKEAGDICAFALFSDESGSSISAAANTTQHLTRQQKEGPDEPLYYKWSPAEWKHDSLASKQLDALSDQLFSFSMDLEGNAFEAYVADLFDRCVNVLLTLKSEGTFTEFHPDFLLLFDVSDYDGRDNQLKWASQLNSQETASEFEAWLRSGDD